MAMDPVTAGIEAVTTVIGKIWPDKSEQERAEIANAFALMQGQQDINKIDAASSSFWQSGWRPGAGWVCVTTLALTYIPKAIVLTAMWTVHACKAPTMPPFPDLGVTDMLGLLLTLLGVGGMRTFERLKGVAR